jgi:hypothetical protein
MLLLTPVLAQNSNLQAQPQPNDQNATASQGQPTAKIAQQIRSNLEKAGFKNIKLMPSSFLVRATDQNNNPGMMVINPDSITEVTESQSGSTATAPSAQNPGAGISGAPGNKNGPPANKGTVGSASENNLSVQEQDSANVKGMPGNKSGPTAKH